MENTIEDLKVMEIRSIGLYFGVNTSLRICLPTEAKILTYSRNSVSLDCRMTYCIPSVNTTAPGKFTAHVFAKIHDGDEIYEGDEIVLCIPGVELAYIVKRA